MKIRKNDFKNKYYDLVDAGMKEKTKETIDFLNQYENIKIKKITTRKIFFKIGEENFLIDKKKELFASCKENYR